MHLRYGTRGAGTTGWAVQAPGKFLQCGPGRIDNT
jgi:hypothetical protein